MSTQSPATLSTPASPGRLRRLYRRVLFAFKWGSKIRHLPALLALITALADPTSRKALIHHAYLTIAATILWVRNVLHGGLTYVRSSIAHLLQNIDNFFTGLSKPFRSSVSRSHAYHTFTSWLSTTFLPFIRSVATHVLHLAARHPVLSGILIVAFLAVHFFTRWAKSIPDYYA